MVSLVLYDDLDGCGSVGGSLGRIDGVKLGRSVELEPQYTLEAVAY